MLLLCVVIHQVAQALESAFYPANVTGLPQGSKTNFVSRKRPCPEFGVTFREHYAASKRKHLESRLGCGEDNASQDGHHKARHFFD